MSAVKGRSFETDTSAQIALDNNDIAVWDNINPGNTVDVSLVYDMPAGAVPASIELHDSMFSGGVTVNPDAVTQKAGPPEQAAPHPTPLNPQPPRHPVEPVEALPVEPGKHHGLPA